ncbi:MAG: phosphoenolpyruvate carboxykinase (ATP) [Chlorobiales bacterium]
MTNLFGFTPTKPIHQNLSVNHLIEFAIRNGEGHLSNTGALVVKTGKKTGRSANDKFIVKEPTSQEKIWWENNKPFEPAHFDALHQKVLRYLSEREFFVQDVFVGADKTYGLKVRVMTEFAWHSAFAKALFIRPTAEELTNFSPDFTVIDVPNFKANPEQDHTLSETFVVLNFEKKIVLIGGTGYAGEIKKSVFTIMNYLMPLRGVLSMHCSANVGTNGDSAVFFGLSGTGKTTLSADPSRGLIGDDEHCWSETSIFNIEGGCYAKCINLSRENEPLIYDAIRYGAIVENVVMNEQTRAINFSDDSLTENTRCAYPIDFIPNAVLPSVGPKPKNIVFLTCDAFGVLPPISRLSPAQAMYHFLLGYTAKVAGTEIGIKEPTMTFSACFGAPFLPLHPTEYAKFLGEKIAKENVRVWLVNTGWSGGGIGVGKRMKIAHTRAMVNAALDSKLDHVDYVEDPIFKVSVPTTCPNVPSEVLIPKNTWADKEAYDQKALWLAKEFVKNFKKYEAFATDEIKAAAPNVAFEIA